MSAGMSGGEAERKNTLMLRVNTALSRLTGSSGTAVFRFWVPGRVEFLGKHTDYAGGRSLLFAAERGMCVAVAPRQDDRLRIRDVTTGETVDESMSQGAQSRAGHWSDYALTVAHRIVRNFPGPLVGADIAFGSDLPQAAGMSSSSALIVAMFLALSRVNDLESRDDYKRAIQTNEDLAEYLGTIENGQSFGGLTGERGVGTFGGSEDHTAILCATAGTLAQYSFCPVHLERSVPFPSHHVLLIAASGVVAEKTGTARDHYNRVATRVAEILERWKFTTGKSYPTLAAAINVSPSSADRIRQMLRSDAAASREANERLSRFEQFLLESSEIVPAAADALARNDLSTLGALVDRSQDAAEQLLGNQVPETTLLARRARELGAVAASAFGAGFGGSVWALVREDDADVFRARWADAYTEQFPTAAQRSEFFVTRSGPGAIAFE